MKVSVSRLKLFKACRRAYELKYVHGLEPVATSDALETGLTYHAKLEGLYKDGMVDCADLSRESAMAVAYAKYIYPAFKMQSVETWVEYKVRRGDTLVGRVDGIAEDGCLVEHKTCSAEIGEDYEYGLSWDEQILAYMLATGARHMWYTVCRKPTIRQKKGESEEEFFQRMVAWYDEDTDSKIRLLRVERTDEEVAEFKEELKRTIHDIKLCKHFYRNCQHCTHWGRRCEYASVCLHYDPEQEYIGFLFKQREVE